MHRVFPCLLKFPENYLAKQNQKKRQDFFKPCHLEKEMHSRALKAM